MKTNHQLIEHFYKAFQQRDYEAMNACYHPDIHFSDPVFSDLRGDQAKAMWQMLCERGADLAVVYSDVQANDSTGRAHWEATYTFSKAGRKVHNIVDAQFRFQNGKIIRHRDDFDLWRWTRMALGPTGVLLGWSPLIQNKVRATASRGLRAYIGKHPQYQDF